MRNLKRALSLALALVMVMSMMVVGAGAVSIDDFTDADEIVNTEAVTTMVSLGVIDGNDDGSYNPTGVVKRGEMAKLIAVMLNGGKDPTLGATPVVFADTAGHWAQNYISYVANLHIIDGRGDGTFGPNDDVTGSEAAKMILTALGYRSDLEGFTGANWAINVQAMANQINLFDGLTINPDEGLSRDNTAQMLYNAVQADMVEYRNLEGSYDGIVYPQPINGVNNDSTVLWERFQVVKVTGILEANDKVSVAGFIRSADGTLTGHEPYSVALEGESLLYVTNVSGYDRENYGRLYDAATYKVETTDDMVGQEIVIYVQYRDYLSPNAAYSTVIGTPILTDNNTVVETTGKLGEAADVRAALRAGGLTNIGTGSNAPDAILYTEGEVRTGVNTGITNEITASAAVRGQEITRSAGIQQRFIDNDGNGYPDYIIQVVPVLSAVNSVNSDASKYTFTGIPGTIDAADVVTEETLERNDVILVNRYADDRYYVTFPDAVEGVVESYNTNNDTVSVDGTSYANSGGKLLYNAGVSQFLEEEMVDNTYRLYLDNYGNVLGYEEIDTIVGNYAVVQGWSRSGSELMGYTAQVKLLMQDGSVGTYDVNLTATAVRLGLIGSGATDAQKEDAIAGDTGIAETYFGDPTLYGVGTNHDGENLVDHLFSYTLDGDTVTLARPWHINSDRYQSAQAISGSSNVNMNAWLDLAKVTNLNKNDTEYEIRTDDSKGNSLTIVADDQTVFFIKDRADDPANASYYAVIGLANLPTNSETAGGAQVVGIPVHGGGDVISYTAPNSTTRVARAIYIETNNVFRSARQFTFVTDKYVYSNAAATPLYTFNVVSMNGETGEMVTATRPEIIKNTVREYYQDGSYITFAGPTADNLYTYDNVYVEAISGNTVTLYDIDSHTYVTSARVDGGADIWDVQDEPVEDSLQVNDMVAVKLDADGVVEAAFIYDVMNGAHPADPTSFTIEGADQTGTLTIPADRKLDLALSVAEDVNVSVSVTHTDAAGNTAATDVSMSESNNNDNTWTGTYTIPADAVSGDTLTFTVTLSQDGLDDHTVTYTTTLANQGADVDGSEPTAFTDVTTGLAAGNDVQVIGGLTAAGNLTIPANQTLTVQGTLDMGSYTLDNQGTLVADGLKVPGNATIGGTVTLGDDTTDGSLTFGGSATITGRLTVNGAATVTLDSRTTIAQGAFFGIPDGTLDLAGQTLVNNGTYNFGTVIGRSGITGTGTGTIGTLELAGTLTLSGSTVTVGEIVESTNATQTLTVTGGTLIVTGNAAADTITVSGGSVEVAGTVTVTDGTNGIVVSGENTVVVVGDVTGDVTVTGGDVTTGAVEGTVTVEGGALDTGAVTGDVTVSGNASLTVTGGITGNYTEDNFTGDSNVTADDVGGNVSTGETEAAAALKKLAEQVQAGNIVARDKNGTDLTGNSYYEVPPAAGTVSVNATVGDVANSIINVELTVEDLAVHYNGQGNAGRWFGIMIPAKDGDQYAWDWGTYDPLKNYTLADLSNVQEGLEGFYRNYNEAGSNTSFFVIHKSAAGADTEATQVVYQVNFTVTPTGSDTVVEPTLDVGAVLTAASGYQYDDNRTNHGTITVDGTTVTWSGAWSNFSDQEGEVLEVTADLSRFMGALYYIDNGATVTSVTSEGTEYTWNAEANEKGSRWTSASGTTLVSDAAKMLTSDFSGVGVVGTEVTESYPFSVNGVDATLTIHVAATGGVGGR